jgi:hypothetical protein
MILSMNLCTHKPRRRPCGARRAAEPVFWAFTLHYIPDPCVRALRVERAAGRVEDSLEIDESLRV